MISKKISLGSFYWLLLVHSCVYAIYDPNDGVKGRGFHRRPEVSEQIVMHHKYSQVASNRPLSRDALQSVDESSRQGRTSYTNEAENYVAQHGLQCPRNATGQFPYLLNCRQFLNCWKGRGHIQSCAPGTVFNPDTRECDNPAKVVCLNYRGESNPSRKSARLQQVPNTDFDEWHAVVSGGGSLDPSDTAKRVQCPPDASGVQPHPLDCSKFLNCANGITYIQDCGPGTVFNALALVCDFPYNVDCSDRNSSTSGSSLHGQDRQYQHHNHHRGNSKWNSTGQEDYSGLSSGNPDIDGGYSDSYRRYTTQDVNQPHKSFRNNRRNETSNQDKDVDKTFHNHSSHHFYQRPYPSHPYNYTVNSQREWRQGTSAFQYGNNRHQHREITAGDHYPSGSSQGNRDPKSDWNPSYVPQNPTAPIHPLNVEQAQVDEMPTSGTSGTSKMTIYYAQPADYDDYNIQQQQQKIPSKFLEPPSPPSYGPNSPPSAVINKTNVYYAKPIGTIDTSHFQGTHRQKPGWKPMTQPLPTNINKTIVYYATPVEDYNRPGNDDQQQQLDAFPDDSTPTEQPPPPIGFLVPPSQSGSEPWRETELPKHNKPAQYNPTYPTNSEPAFDSFHRRRQFTPTSEQTRTVANVNTLASAPPKPAPPTASLVPAPQGESLPPKAVTKVAPLPTVPSVLYPPLDPTTPLQVNHNRQERVFVVHPQSSSGSKPAVDITTSVLYSSPYSGVVHTTANKHEIGAKSVEEPIEEKKIVPIYNRPSSFHSTTMMAKTPVHSPHPYNTNYYNPPEAHTVASGTPEPTIPQFSVASTELPISEALKMLLRPYFNRSGTVTEDVVSKMDAHILKLWTPSKQPTKQQPKNTQTKSEAELLFPGEQANMNQGAQDNQGDASHEDSNENTTKEKTYHTGWHRHHHHNQSHHGHGSYHHNHTHNHQHPYHRHHDHHYHQDHHQHPWRSHNASSQHSQDFHRKHPNLPNPFATNTLDEPVSTDTFNRRVDSIDPRQDDNPTRDQQNFTEEFFPPLDADKPACQFDCNNGKCISQYQVCDGVNNCGNRLDEKDCDDIGYEVRLSSDEGKANMGRVEVKVRGQWGYVCDDKFGMRAADILCRELGFVLGASEVRGNSYYPPHKEMYDELGVRYLMDEVDCMGNETSIRECNFKGWGVHDCSPEEVVGVVCKIPVMTCPANYWLCKTSQECVAVGFLCDSVPDCQDGSDESDEICNETIQYRLHGGFSGMEGRVEVKYRDTWGTICDDDFGKKEAQVVCRTLGFLGDAVVIKNAYGAGSGPIWLDQVSCLGNETTLEQCSHWAWGEHNCDHQEDVSVRCSERPKNPRAEPTTSTTEPTLQFPEEDIDLFLYKVQRSSKAINHNKRCGQINEHTIDEFNTNDEFARVVNGTKAIRGHHPWQASLRAKGRNGMSTHWCGAILITQMHVLTAAHCLVGYQKEGLFVRMGDHYSKIAEPSEIDSFIQNWYVHEDFRKGHHMNNDIGLIVLKSPVIFNDYIQPICLPAKDAPYEEGVKCTISGWGSIKSGISTPSNNLKAAHVPIIAQAICKEPYVYGNAITDGMFCAGYLDEGVDACDGDSGGPLACSSPSGETLYGIISWGQHCGQANKPGVYVKVAHYLDWIMDKIMFSMKAKTNN